jgi:hypothetical protein
VLPKYCFGNPDLLVGTRLITLSRNGVPVAEKNTGTPQKNEPERRSGRQKKNRNAVPVRSGPFRTLPRHAPVADWLLVSRGSWATCFIQLAYRPLFTNSSVALQS